MKAIREIPVNMIRRQYDFEVLRQGAMRYVWGLRRGTSFEFPVSAHDQAKPVAIGSATAALLLNFLGGLDVLSENDRLSWCNLLLPALEPDGVCSDRIDLCEPTQLQPEWALVGHRTRHILWAIEALGGIPRRRPAFIEPFLQKGFVSKWLDDLWQQQWEGGFWAAGNWIMDVAVMLDATWRHFKNTVAFNAIHELLDALDRRQCSRTGYWFGPHDTNREAMAGAMHIYPVYWAYNRQINHLSEAVDNTIQLQQSDGLFDYSIGSGGSQCLDYDAVLVLANGLVLCPEYRQQIRSACSRVLDAIMVNHQPDGSFSDSLQETQRHWATRAAVYFANKGSLWDTYARLMTVAICLEIVTGVPTTNARFEHHWFELFHGGRGWKDGFFQTD